MPMVPYTDNVVPMQGQQKAPEIEPRFLLMAAATMHQQGRLFEPEPAVKGPDGSHN